MSTREEKLVGLIKMARQWIDISKDAELGSQARISARTCLNDVLNLLRKPKEEAPQEASRNRGKEAQAYLEATEAETDTMMKLVAVVGDLQERLNKLEKKVKS
jgi:hypothetical protein